MDDNICTFCIEISTTSVTRHKNTPKDVKRCKSHTTILYTTVTTFKVLVLRTCFAWGKLA